MNITRGSTVDKIRTHEDVEHDCAVAQSVLEKLQHCRAGRALEETARERVAMLAAELRVQGWSPAAAGVRAAVVSAEDVQRQRATAQAYFVQTGWTPAAAAELADIHVRMGQ